MHVLWLQQTLLVWFGNFQGNWRIPFFTCVTSAYGKVGQVLWILLTFLYIYAVIKLSRSVQVKHQKDSPGHVISDVITEVHWRFFVSLNIILSHPVDLVSTVQVTARIPMVVKYSPLWQSRKENQWLSPKYIAQSACQSCLMPCISVRWGGMVCLVSLPHGLTCYEEWHLANITGKIFFFIYHHIGILYLTWYSNITVRKSVIVEKMIFVNFFCC